MSAQNHTTGTEASPVKERAARHADDDEQLALTDFEVGTDARRQ